MTNKKPNILYIMADQLAPQALPTYGNSVVKAPNIESLGNDGVVFDNAYCNSPLCGPSRASMLTSRYASSIETFDNASEFPSSTPTLLHYLRNFDYRTILSGKMHFIGPDQLHGFEERLTTDIYPADFGWTPNWDEGEFNKPTNISMRGVVEAGQCYRNLQIDYDDEVEFKTVQKIYDMARDSDEDDRPFFLCTSFSNPHSPFQITPEYWDRYNHDDIDLPTVPNIPMEEMDAFSQWLQIAHGMDRHSITEEHILNARHAYYGMISYIDDKVGNLMKTLEECGMRENTIVILGSDHGEMLGERGMWYKQTFFEWSARVPLIVSNKNYFSKKRISEVVSLIDLFPTILDMISSENTPELVSPIDGESMMGLMKGYDKEWHDTAISEYFAEGTREPCMMIRKGRYKYIYTHGYPGILYDLEIDPSELNNIVGQENVKDVEKDLRNELLNKIDPNELKSRILESQKQRRFIQNILHSGSQPKWDFQVSLQNTNQYLTSGASPMETKSKMRWPRVKATPEDLPGINRKDV